LSEALEDCIKEMGIHIRESIYDQYGIAIDNAQSNATPTAQKWGAPKPEGGYYWSTYKAICRRNGVFTNGSGGHDFNGQLAEPLLKHLGTGWEKAFQRRLPATLNAFTTNAERLLLDFHGAMHTHAQQQNTSLAGMSMLANQLNVYVQLFKQVANQMVAVITEMQRNANREFTPVIAARMELAYEICTNERGSSCSPVPRPSIEGEG
jgi:hypothetical protein